jgi:hypothetical protein
MARKQGEMAFLWTFAWIGILIFTAGCSASRVQTVESLEARARQLKIMAESSAESKIGTLEGKKEEAQTIQQKIGQDDPLVSEYLVSRLALPEFERLTYHADYLGINVGVITASIEGKTQIRGRDVYKFEVVAQTNPFFSKIFKLEDRFVSYMDVENLHVLRQEVYRREGNYKKDAVVDFDHENGKAYFKHLLNGDEKVIDIPYGVQDAVTANYIVRTLPWGVGDTVRFQVYVDEKVYDFVGLIPQTTSLNVAKMGRLEAFVFEPYAVLEGEVVKKGKATGYFHTGGLKRPLRGVVNTPIFGKASITLMSYN